MTTRSRVRALSGAVLVVLAGACASTRNGRAGGEAGEQGNVTFEVENNTVPSNDLTVYLVSESGTRQLLGSVLPNRVGTLSLRNPPLVGRYRLLARSVAGPQIASNTFSLGSTSKVRWSLQSNIAVAVD